MYVILVVVKDEPKVIYKRFERRLLINLPADQPDFIKLLEREDLIGEKSKRKMNTPNQTRGGCAVFCRKSIHCHFLMRSFTNYLM